MSGKPGRPRKNAVVELKDQSEDLTEDQVEELTDFTESAEYQDALEALESCRKECEDLRRQLQEANLKVTSLQERSLSKETAQRLSELVLDSVRKSNNVTWRKEGKSLLEQLTKLT